MATAHTTVTDPTGQGYCLSPSDGGEACLQQPRNTYYGSLPTLHVTPNAPIIGMVAAPTGKGYWLIGADGGVYSFGSAKFLGSTGNITLNQP